MNRDELVERMISEGWIDARAFVASCDEDELAEVVRGLDRADLGATEASE